MSLIQNFNELNENEKIQFMEEISNDNIKLLIRLVNKHYAVSRRNYQKKRYNEDEIYKQSKLEQNKKCYLKKRAEKKDCNNINE